MRIEKFMFIVATAILWTLTTIAADDHGKAEKFYFKWTKRPYFTKKSHMKDSYYHGIMVGRCEISGMHGGGLTNLKNLFQKWVEEHANTNHPRYPNKWVKEKRYFDIDGKKKLDAMRRPCTSFTKNDDGSIKINHVSYLAHERGKHLIFYVETDSIVHAIGENNQRLKNVQSYLHFTKAEKPGHYNIYIWRYYKVESHWYEPESLFVKGVVQGTIKTFFEEMLDRSLERWVNNL